MIQPPPEETICDMAELERRNWNYTLIYENPGWVTSVKRSVQGSGLISPDRLVLSRVIGKGVNLYNDKLD